MNHESFHQSDPNREMLQVQRSMIKLGFDLEQYGAYYWGTRKSLNAYLREEYGLEISDARLYIRELESIGYLPGPARYAMGDERLTDDYRKAVYAHFIPLYRDTHTAAEFELWLPAAIDVVFPADDPHLAAECRPSGEEVLDYPGMSCRMSRTCRRRMVMADIIRNGAFIAPMWPARLGEDEVTREQARELDSMARDPWRAYEDSMTLLRTLADKGILDQDGALIVEMRLQEKMHEVFGITADE